jgi:FG-GAP repeat
MPWLVLPLFGAGLVSAAFCIWANDSEQMPHFSQQALAADLAGGYQVVAADLNGDGKPDLIALASNMTELVWFENPDWQRHVIASNLQNMINAAGMRH